MSLRRLVEWYHRAERGVGHRHIAGQYNIDPDRIYITGLSMGGFGTWGAVTRRPGLFAAAVPMSGYGNASDAASVRSIPFLVFSCRQGSNG